MNIEGREISYPIFLFGSFALIHWYRLIMWTFIDINEYKKKKKIHSLPPLVFYLHISYLFQFIIIIFFNKKNDEKVEGVK